HKIRFTRGMQKSLRHACDLSPSAEIANARWPRAAGRTGLAPTAIRRQARVSKATSRPASCAYGGGERLIKDKGTADAENMGSTTKFGLRPQPQIIATKPMGAISEGAVPNHI